MSGAPNPSSAGPRWVPRIFGILLLLAFLAATPYLWKATKAIIPSYKENAKATLKVRAKLLAPLAGKYVGALAAAGLGIWLLRRAGKKAASQTAPLTVAQTEVAPPAPPKPKAIRGPVKKRWRACNILQSGLNTQSLWQFDVRGNRFNLNREQTLPPETPVPVHLANKNWSSLWNPRLNVAWLPAKSVFLRIVQLPSSSTEEMLSMLELQLEKLSPIPLNQLVWSVSRVSGSRAQGALETYIVTLAERKAVEEFLGKLEGQGYLADRLELPALDQLEATPNTEDGAWIYPGDWNSSNTALVAWWCGGTLQNLNFVTLPEGGDRVTGLREQLAQMSWAGEFEGWLTGPLKWHLVADAATGAEWLEALRQSLDEPVEIYLPLNPADLAARTAARAANPETPTGLMPPEFATRYRQQFVDKLWLHALFAAGSVWVAYVVIYLVAVTMFDVRTRGVEQRAAQTSVTYTNAIQLKAKMAVLKERQELKYAALDCWRAVAETLPDTVTVENLNFGEGRKLSLSGTAPADQAGKVTEFNDLIRKVTINSQPLFDDDAGDPLSYRVNPGNSILTWNFGLELRRAEQ